MKCVGIRDKTVSFIVGGQAGQGITRSGSLLGRAFLRGGFSVFGMNDYPSVIRGSHNFYVLRVSEEKIYSHSDKADILLALDKRSVLLHELNLNQKGGVIYDKETQFAEGELKSSDLNLYPVPISSFVDEVGGPPIIKNAVVMGAAIGLLGFDLKIMQGVISDTFSGREDIIEMNCRLIEMGLDYVEREYGDSFSCRLEPSQKRLESILLTGNDAVALGAIQAGCKFYAAYPMTPVSPLLHYLSAHDVDSRMVVIQTESEIAALNMVVGASYTGLRAMTATSGGGFCLMTEALGLAAMTETPVVIMLGQRPGPSTGLATDTSQGDLLFAIHASQGEFPRVVVAPGDVEECFYLTMEAFNLAEKFQIPVIILTDKYLLESHMSSAPFKIEEINIDRGDLLIVDEWNNVEEYKRYKFTVNGISPRLLLGTRGATVLANSNEKLEYGYTTRDSKEVIESVDKRFRKWDALIEEIDKKETLKIYGSNEPEITIVGWGSTKGPALEALKLLKQEGIEACFSQVLYLEPFPKRAVEEMLRRGGEFLLAEVNRKSQLGTLIKLHNGFSFNHTLSKYNGRPLNPVEIYQRAKEVR